MRKFYTSFMTAVAMLVMSVGFVAVAQAQSVNQLLADPKVDDIYVARVDHFSDGGFEDYGTTYALMRVVEVSSTKIIVITEDAGWEDSEGAVGDMNGDFSGIDWDHTEEIVIQRSELAELKKSGMIVDARRLTAEQIANYLD